MKRLFYYLSLLLLTAGVARADVYIREVVQVRSWFLGVVPLGKETFVNETWIGPGRISSREGSRTIIVNLADSTLLFLNHRAKTYLETRVPLDLDAFLSDEVKQIFQARQITGTVEATGRTREVLDKTCQEYVVTFRDISGDTRTKSRPLKVWASQEVDVDYDVFYTFLENLRLIYNRDETAREELRKIKDIQMRTRIINQHPGWVRRLVVEVDEITEQVPPGDTYGIPTGFTRKDRFQLEDLNL
jgi:hypothetical protein